jgi:hypothetical protein
LAPERSRGPIERVLSFEAILFRLIGQSCALLTIRWAL